MTLPNFLVVGAGRSGTTSLHHHLDQHPDVYVPRVKAPSFFYAVDAVAPSTSERRLVDRDQFVHDRVAYESLFDDWAGEQAIGEVSPAYLSSPRVPERIAALLPDARIVAIVRNPIERIHARFVARKRDGLETLPDLASVIRREVTEGIDLDDTAGTYLAAGFISHVVQGYVDRFPPERLRICLYDDLRRDAPGTIRDLFRFLDVDPDAPVATQIAHNRSGGTIANPVVRAVWTRSAPVRLRVRRRVPRAIRDRAFALATRRLVEVPLDETVRAELVGQYRAEVAQLAAILGRDLSSWLAVPGMVRQEQTR